MTSDDGAASAHGASELRGQLLAAAPYLGDDNFEETLVFLIEHGEHGALGVVLNRPSEQAVAEPLPGWSRLSSHPSVLFQGGPVEEGVAIGLAVVESGATSDAWDLVTERIAVLDLARDPDMVGDQVDDVRIFRGYAGWGPGQLEAEIGAGAWYVLDHEPGDAADPEPSKLWRKVMRRQGGHLAALAHYPDDPSVN